MNFEAGISDESIVDTHFGPKLTTNAERVFAILLVIMLARNS